MTIISSGVRPASAIGQNSSQSNSGKAGLKPQVLNGFAMPAKQDVFFSGLGSRNKDIDKLDKEGSNALHRAILRHSVAGWDKFKMKPDAEVRQLLDKGANVNAICATGEPPIVLLVHEALRANSISLHMGGSGFNIRHDNENKLKHLLSKAGIEVDKPDNMGRTALSHTVNRYRDADVNYFRNALLKAGADINKKDDLGRTPLSYAAERNDRDVKWFIEHGADVNIPDLEGRTPISYAAEHGNPLAIQDLLHAGSDYKSPDHDNKTPLDYAEEAGADNIANLFTKAQLLSAALKSTEEKKEKSQNPKSDDSDEELARWNAEFPMPGGFGDKNTGLDASKKKSADAGETLPEMDGRSIHELDGNHHKPKPQELDGNEVHELLVEHPELDGNEIYELPAEREPESSNSRRSFLSRFTR